MDLIEIDPELFMKCRLCVDEKGSFQIIPSVQQQIKHCFDISVQPFDGLSQLVCRKCKVILEEYNLLKKKYQEKQELLVAKTKPKSELTSKKETQQAQQEAVTSSQQDDKYLETITEEQKLPKQAKKVGRRTSRPISSSTEDEDKKKSECSIQRKSIVKVSKALTLKKTDNGKSNSWKKYFQHKYVCKYCDSTYSLRKYIEKHVCIYKKLLNNRSDFVPKYCNVQLNKVDDKANLTGDSSVVVISPTKLVRDEVFCDYYSIYNCKSANPSNEQFDNTNSFCVENEHQESVSSDERKSRERGKRYHCSDVTSSEDESVARPKLKKRIRVISNSSADTQIIDDIDSKQSMNGSDAENANTYDDAKSPSQESREIPCINIDDTSTDVADINIQAITPVSDVLIEAQKKKGIKPKENNHKIIRSIVSVSYNNFVKRFNRLGQDSKGPKKPTKADHDSLNRKLLSIGRKVMSKKGIVSMGLLKYLKHKNLSIFWTKSTSNGPASKEAEYVRIMTKFRDKLNLDSLMGFTVCKNFDIKYRDTENTLTNSKKVYSNSKAIMPQVDATNGKPETSLNQVVNVNALDTSGRLFISVPNVVKSKLPPTPPVVMPPTPPVLTPLPAENSGSQLLTLLNASPVPNPKQAPKKKTPVEQPFAGSITNVPVEPAMLSKNVSSSKHDHNYDVDLICIDLDEDLTAPSMPIITSTLSLALPMESSEFETVIVCPQEDPTKGSDGNDVPKYPRIKCKPVSELMPTSLEPVKPKASGGNVPRGYIMLDTVTLPNTVTQSPFTYLKDLLNIHSLFLLDAEETLTPDFACLVKFKLGVHQHPMSIMLCLSLCANGQRFCIQVKNATQDLVNVMKMSALWQWEVLKAFHDESVVGKILQCAERSSMALHKNAKLFLVLLSSIKLVAEGALS